MSREISITTADGLTLYAVIEALASGDYWNQSLNSGAGGFEAFNAAHWIAADYCVALVETVLSANSQGVYQVNFPTGIGTAGFYLTNVYMQAGADPSVSADGKPQWTYGFYWNGTAIVYPAITSGTGSGNAIVNSATDPSGQLYMVSAATNAPVAGLIVTAYLASDWNARNFFNPQAYSVTSSDGSFGILGGSPPMNLNHGVTYVFNWAAPGWESYQYTFTIP